MYKSDHLGFEIELGMFFGVSKTNFVTDIDVHPCNRTRRTTGAAREELI